jgi:hypothetical protein
LQYTYAQGRRLSVLDLAILHVIVLRHLETLIAPSREEMHSQLSSDNVEMALSWSPPPDRHRSFEETWDLYVLEDADSDWHLTAGFGNLE